MKRNSYLQPRPNFRAQSLLTFLIMFVFLSWPLIVNRNPFYIADSISYLKGGQYALSLVSERIVYGFSDSSLGNETSQPVQNVTVIGARSPIYSVLAALLRFPHSTMLLLGLVQIAAVNFVLFQAARIYGFRSRRSMLGLAAIMAIFTSVPWYAALAVPDILAGLGICAIAVLAIHTEHLGRMDKLILAGLVALSVACHASHIPLIAIQVIAASVLIYFFPLQNFKIGRKVVIAWLFGSFLFGLGSSMLAGFTGFGDASPIAKRYPFALARSVVDGPARLHLEKHCIQYQYAICELFSEFPRNIDDFLWSEKGIRMRASSDQMNRIRQEEALILSRTAREYPVEVLIAFSSNTLDQLLTFGIDDVDFGQLLVLQENGLVLQSKRSHSNSYLPFLDALQYTVVCISVFYILVQFGMKKLDRKDLFFLGLLAIGLFANAAICGGLSAVAERYQGRVVWVVPLSAALLFYRVTFCGKGT